MSNPASLALWFLCLIGLLVPEVTAQTAAAELDLGVAACKSAKYDEAVQHFQKAVFLEPTLQRAHLYLGTTFAQQYILGIDTPDNNKMAEQAIAEYNAVLQLDPKNINSLKGIAYLYLQMKKFDEAKDYYRNAIDIDSGDPELYYSVGVIDWTQSYQPSMEGRAKLKLKPEESFIGYPECWNVRAKNEDHITEGIEMLTQAITLRHDYDDAMAYMNLLYRQQADTECGNQRAYAADLKTADKWVDLAMATRKYKAEAVKMPNGPDVLKSRQCGQDVVPKTQ